MDLKCPGSGELKRNLWSNLDHLTELDEIKFVVKDRIDYEWARKTIYDKGLKQRLEEGSLRALLISPVWGQIDLETLASWVLEDGLPVRFQLQLHKQIWGSERTGV
jgi:7-carboxy-7-deazaguanine synthase